MRRSKQCPTDLKFSCDNAGRKGEQGAGGSHRCLKFGHLYDKWKILLDASLVYLRKCAAEYWTRACLMHGRTSFLHGRRSDFELV